MEACAATDPDAYFELNWAFHRRIARGCRNAPLHSIYLTLLDFLEDGLRPGDLREFHPEDDVAIHRELVDAIEEGPGPRLDAAVGRHVAMPIDLRNPQSRSRPAAQTRRRRRLALEAGARDGRAAGRAQPALADLGVDRVGGLLRRAAGSGCAARACSRGSRGPRR